MDANTSVGPVRWEERTLGVITLIIATTALVFYLDTITPLGLTVWILYFIPLYLTFYVRWRMAPFAATAVFIALIGVTSVLSYRDVSLVYALLNRLFFAGMLAVSALFIWNAGRAVDQVQVSEERHRHLSESCPDPILVSAGERILYANPAGEQMFAADPAHELVGRQFADLVDPSERESMRDRMRQTMEGARMHLSAIRMTRLDGRPLCADATLGEIVWDGDPAVQIVLRPAGNPSRAVRAASSPRSASGP
jgi:PAS domain S-box-containing protein